MPTKTRKRKSRRIQRFRRKHYQLRLRLWGTTRGGRCSIKRRAKRVRRKPDGVQLELDFTRPIDAQLYFAFAA